MRRKRRNIMTEMLDLVITGERERERDLLCNSSTIAL